MLYNAFATISNIQASCLICGSIISKGDNYLVGKNSFTGELMTPILCMKCINKKPNIDKIFINIDKIDWKTPQAQGVGIIGLVRMMFMQKRARSYLSKTYGCKKFNYERELHNIHLDKINIHNHGKYNLVKVNKSYASKWTSLFLLILMMLSWWVFSTL